MDLTQEQAKMLIELAGKIQSEYGIKIGYNNPSIPHSGVDADFLIFDNQEAGYIACYYKDDVETRKVGSLIVMIVPEEEEAQSDYKVEELIDQINNDLLNGKLWFDCSIAKEKDDLKVEVTRKIYPGNLEVFDTNIFTEGFGNIYSYKEIVSASLTDEKFRLAREIIDENWPRKNPPIPAIPAKPKKKKFSIIRFLRGFLRP